MIDQNELAQVREINAKLPFAHPIEQGEAPSTRIFFGPPVDGPVTVAMLNEMCDVTHLFEPDSFEPTLGGRIIAIGSAAKPGTPFGRIFTHD